MACFWGLVAVECVLLDLWFCDCLASELQAVRASMRNKNRAFLTRVMAIVVQIWVGRLLGFVEFGVDDGYADAHE